MGFGSRCTYCINTRSIVRLSVGLLRLLQPTAADSTACAGVIDIYVYYAHGDYEDIDNDDDDNMNYNIRIK